MADPQFNGAIDSNQLLTIIKQHEYHLPRRITYAGSFDAIGETNHHFFIPHRKSNNPIKEYAIYCTTRKPKPGHWILAKIKPNDAVILFDSLGLLDTEKPNKTYAEVLNTIKRRYQLPVKTAYNYQKFQRDDTDTCGAWCLGKMLFDDFNSLFVGINPLNQSERDYDILTTNETTLVQTLHNRYPPKPLYKNT